MLDLTSAGREGSEQCLGDTVEFGHATGHLAEAHAQGPGEAGTQGALVEETGGPGVAVEEAGVGSGPDAVDPFGHVGHQHMGVELGVARPRGPVREGGRHEPLGPDTGLAACAPADTEGMALEVAEGLVDGVLVDAADDGRGGRVREPEEQGDRFGGGPGEVEAGHPLGLVHPAGRQDLALG